MKKRDEINAFLGKDTEFEGRLSFTGCVRIDGRFKGEIDSQGTLIVGETALLESDVHIFDIIINGEFRGNILAENRIEIHTPGKVFGNIRSPVVVIDEGVVFEGNCQMLGEDIPEEKKPASVGDSGFRPMVLKSPAPKEVKI